MAGQRPVWLDLPPIEAARWSFTATHQGGFLVAGESGGQRCAPPPFIAGWALTQTTASCFPPGHPCPVYVACMLCDVVVLAAVICSSAANAVAAGNTCAKHRAVPRTASVAADLLRSTAKFDSIFCSSCHGQGQAGALAASRSFLVDTIKRKPASDRQGSWTHCCS